MRPSGAGLVNMSGQECTFSYMYTGQLPPWGPIRRGPICRNKISMGPNLPPRGPICRGPICRGPICRQGAQSAGARFAGDQFAGAQFAGAQSAGAQFATKNCSGSNLPGPNLPRTTPGYPHFLLIFIGPRYTWGPIYGSECL